MGRMLTELGIAIVVLMFAPAPIQAADPLPPSLADRIREYAAGVFDELGVPGAVVVVVDDEGTRFAEGFGSADGEGRAITPQTPFRIASLSKQLTGLAARQLVDAGTLSLDTTVGDILPWFGEANADAAAITVLDLLAHTAGWSERDGTAALIDASASDDALERSVRRLSAVEGIGPGRPFEYSNASYDVLGLVIASVSGTGFEAHLREHVLEPLGMEDTHLSWETAADGGIAEGHYPFFGIPLAYDLPFSRATLPSASMISSGEDLGHVLTALLADGRFGTTIVLEPGAASSMRIPLVEPFPASGYGWGWWSYPLYEAGVRIVGDADAHYEAPIILEHSGSLGTFASEMVLMPEASLGIVVLTNLNDEAAPSRFYQAHVGIASILSGLEPPELTSYDDPLRQVAKPLMLVTVLLQAVGIAIAVRRLRAWRRAPPIESSTFGWRVRHLVLPLALDTAVPAVFWLLLAEASQLLPVDWIRVVVLAPDIGIALGLITLLGIGWGVLRTVLTVLAIGRRTDAEPKSAG